MRHASCSIGDLKMNEPCRNLTRSISWVGFDDGAELMPCIRAKSKLIFTLRDDSEGEK